jgi:anti-anti-sigma regulatory factor
VKLVLQKEKDLSILSVLGPVSQDQARILQAGIKKLLREGKHKIVLDFEEPRSLNVESLQLLLELHIMATELSGQIVLSGIDPATQVTIRNLSNPPLLKAFSSKEEAFQSFPKPRDLDDSPPLTSAPSGSQAEIKATAPVASEEEVSKLKEEILARERGDLGELRKKLASLEKQNAELKLRIQEVYRERRYPLDEKGLQSQIETLELKLSEALEERK